MNELIKLGQSDIGGEKIETVNARDLHEFLEIGKDFSTWIKDRVQQYGFVANQDYIVISLPPESGRGNRGAKIDYFLTIDMAKELSMVERNDKGKQARQYFIECEKKSKTSLPDFANPAIAARSWAEQYERAQIAEQTKAEIGSRREATAMNTASQAAKKANKLERVLVRSNEYVTVKRMAAKHRNMHFNWRELKRVSQDLNCPPIDVFDANYGSVKAYHADVWLEAYGVDVPRFTPLAGAA